MKFTIIVEDEPYYTESNGIVSEAAAVSKTHGAIYRGSFEEMKEWAYNMIVNDKYSVVIYINPYYLGEGNG